MTNNDLDLKEFGGKGLSLIKLKNYGYNVPDFFIITATMFKDFIKYNNLEDEIKKYLREKDFLKIQSLIMNGEFENSFANWVQEEFQKLNTSKVSVRSSCSKEDGIDKSYAGQFYTGLYITKDNLFSEIKKCFASLYNKYLVNYAEDIYTSFEMAVVIQKMIDSEYSGVAFSTDFLNINKNTAIIEACQGIGENLVSGKTTPTKYFIRKKKEYIEYFIGETLPIDDYIVNLANILEDIEKNYNMPVDVEWAIENKQLYILQTRPIVGFIETKNQYKLNFSRPNMLGMVELDELSERIGLKELFAGLYYFKPLFKFSENHIFEVYYSLSTTIENPTCMVNYINNNKDTYKNIITNIYNTSNELYQNITDITNDNLDSIIKIYKNAGAIADIINFFDKINVNILVNDYNENADLEFKEFITKYRDFFNDIEYKINDIMVAKAKAILPINLQKYANVITIDELLNNRIDINILEKRYNKGFIYFDGKIIYPDTYNDFFESENIEILDDTLVSGESALQGLVAYPGNVSGKVKIVYNEDDFAKVNKNDIIVSPMTTPTFISLMDNVSAIITDEGGTVCHAALIARELKKTCIVGTKNATKILKDGMEIAIDGTTGKVTILKDMINNE